MQTAQKIEAWWPAKLQCLFRPKRYKVLYGGRGSGKSWGVARALLVEGFSRPLRVLCTRETQSSINDSVHQLLTDQIESLGLGHHYQVKEAEIVGVNGTLFKFAGLRQQDVTKIKSFEGFDICWCEEAQAISEKSWGILIPTIRKPDSEIWITFNPELDTDPTYERFITNTPPDCHTEFINWRDNPWFPEVLDLERKHLKLVDPESYENVWEGKCKAAVDGAIYNNELQQCITEKRIRPVPYDPLLKVHTVWDLGFNDSTAIILVQRAQSEIRIIDYIEDSHRTLDDYVAEINAKRLNWGTDFLPHDGAARNLQTGMSPKDIISRLGRSAQIIPNTKVEMGIKAARLIFRQCYFDEGKAKRLVECLKRYRRNIPTSTNEPANPIHDEYSHGADAFRMLALVANQLDNDDMGPIEYDNRGIV